MLHIFCLCLSFFQDLNYVNMSIYSCVCVCASPVSDQMDFSNISVYFKSRLKDPQIWWWQSGQFPASCCFFFIKNTIKTHKHTHFISLCCMAAGWLGLILLSYHFHRSSFVILTLACCSGLNVLIHFSVLTGKWSKWLNLVPEVQWIRLMHLPAWCWQSF